MIKLLRIIFVISGILTFSALVIVCTLYYLVSNSLPKYNQQLSSTGISERVTINRDAYAIPYIKSQNNADSFFALGYAHAQDRLWQMVLLRRIAQGKLSEILGSKALEGDILMRTLSIYKNAQNSEKYQTESIATLLNSYSSGINSYIKQISDMGLGRGSPEFFLFTPKVSPWRPADSIAIIKLIAFLSSDKAIREVLRTQFKLAKLSSDRMNDIFNEPPLINDEQNQTISYLRKNQYESMVSPEHEIDKKHLFGSWEEVSLKGGLGASNIFAVMPSRSATGFTLAASDPHSMLTTPSNFMLVSMNLSNGNVIGGTIPGVPAILVGRGKDIAWGISNAKVDDQDLFIEKLNPEDQSKYFTENGLAQINIRSEIIKIKDKKSITIEVKTTQNGPILPLKLLGIHTIRPQGHEISINWTGLSSTDRSIESLISLMLSRTITEAEEKLHLLEAPAQNVMLVDSKNISIITAGALPKRNKNHSTKGKIPSLSWNDANTWVGTLPFEINPKTKNPKSGLVVNTNNKITNEEFPHHISYDWGDSQRIIRARNLLFKRQFHTVSSFKEIQTDTISISARILLPLMAKNLWFSPNTNQKFNLTKSESNALELLSLWNGDMNKNNSEPLLYATWVSEFQKLVMKDELGVLYDNLSNVLPLFLERVLRDKNGAAKWCDIVQTTKTETCDEIAKRALTGSILSLSKKFGSNINAWRWGDEHIAVHKPQIMGTWPILSFFTNIVHGISGGDNTLMMSRMINSSKNQFIANHGSTLRAIYDFSPNSASLFVISTGQSGHFLSQHYDDQSILWQQEQYISLDHNKKFLDGTAPMTVFTPISNSIN